MENISLGDINLHDVGNTIQMVGTIWSDGRDLAFVTTFPQNTDEIKNLKVMPLSLEDWQAFIRQTDLMETEILQRGPEGVIKTLVRKSQRQIDAQMQWSVFNRDNFTCRYCGIRGVPLSVDHVILWENGGATIPDNLLTSCKKCNRVRGNTEYDEWINSSYYQQRSIHLPEVVRLQNLEVLRDLPRLRQLTVQNIRSR